MGDNMLFNKNDKKHRYTCSKTSDLESMDLTNENIRKILGDNADFIDREIFINEEKSISVSLLFFDGMVHINYVSEYIIKPLLENERIKQSKDEKSVLEVVLEGNINYANQKTSKDINSVIDDLLYGNTVLVFNNEKTAFVFDTRGFEKRAITEPVSENVVKGPRDSFVETFRVNTSLVRRKLKTPDLIIEQTVVGKRSHTVAGIVYIKGLTNMKFVEEARKRLNAIHEDAVMSTSFIEDYLVDDTNSSFPQLQGTERPDKFCADILEGRVGILIEGLPVAFTVPSILVQFLQASDDYANNYLIASVIRFMRFTLAIVTLVFPGFYIALTTFHQEMIPTVLALSISKAKAGVAFPSFIEIIMMLIAFEILLEAGKRMPKNIGQAVTIVGALIIGDAAVGAKLVSPVIVVVIATIAICNMVIPDQDLSNALRIWRLILATLSGLIGLFGLIVGIILIIFKLSCLESFYVPYLSPFVSCDDISLKDTIFRSSIKAQKKRPEAFKTENVRRRS